MTEHIQLYPVAVLENLVLIISTSDLGKLESGNLTGISGVVIDLFSRKVSQPYPLELHLKHNPWNEIDSSQNRDIILKQIMDNFEPRIILNELAGSVGSQDKPE